MENLPEEQSYTTFPRLAPGEDVTAALGPQIDRPLADRVARFRQYSGDLPALDEYLNGAYDTSLADAQAWTAQSLGGNIERFRGPRDAQALPESAVPSEVLDATDRAAQSIANSYGASADDPEVRQAAKLGGLFSLTKPMLDEALPTKPPTEGPKVPKDHELLTDETEIARVVEACRGRLALAQSALDLELKTHGRTRLDGQLVANLTSGVMIATNTLANATRGFVPVEHTTTADDDIMERVVTGLRRNTLITNTDGTTRYVTPQELREKAS